MLLICRPFWKHGFSSAFLGNCLPSLSGTEPGEAVLTINGEPTRCLIGVSSVVAFAAVLQMMRFFFSRMLYLEWLTTCINKFYIMIIIIILNHPKTWACLIATPRCGLVRQMGEAQA